jgi:HK97 family phage major capsid protein
MNRLQELRARRLAITAEMGTIANAETQTDELRTKFDGLETELKSVDGQIAMIERVANEEARNAELTRKPMRPDGAPMEIRASNRGDNPAKVEARAMRIYLRSGDGAALNELRASNDTDMNVGTSADGGYVVPTGHYNGIIARRDELMAAKQLGVTQIPGTGTTVNVPTDGEDDGEFVSTNEAASFDRDAPALGQVAMTLVKYTKKVELSYELLEDEDSRLMAFLDNFVGRGAAKTHNALLVAALAAGGTAAATFTTNSAITLDKIPELVYSLPDPYQDSGAWLMRRTTEGHIRGLSGTSNWYFAPNASGGVGSRAELWGYPIVNSQAVAAIATVAKSVYFGNFQFVGLREGPGMTFLRDPYSGAATGQVKLFYYFRAVYKVLQAEAIRIGTHAS